MKDAPVNEGLQVKLTGAVLYSAVRCGTVRYGAVQCGTVLYSAVRCGTVRCGTDSALQLTVRSRRYRTGGREGWIEQLKHSTSIGLLCARNKTTLSAAKMSTEAVFQFYNRQCKVEHSFRPLNHPFHVRPLVVLSLSIR
jgi:hypothetical protein